MPILSKRFQNVASIPFRRDEVSGVPARISSNGRPSPASACASVEESSSDFLDCGPACAPRRPATPSRHLNIIFSRTSLSNFVGGRLLRQAESRSEQYLRFPNITSLKRVASIP